tara:strand:- start:573 stop:1244 length:672 start_codon:yes stop_codon:yes gene_type:complete
MKILISGCSFTAPPIKNSPKTQKSIPDYLPGEVERYSEQGAGNIYIVRSLLSRLQELKNLGNLSDVKVICQLTYSNRYDLYLRNIDEIDKYKKTDKVLVKSIQDDYYYTLGLNNQTILCSDYYKYYQCSTEDILRTIDLVMLLQNFCIRNNVPLKFFQFESFEKINRYIKSSDYDKFFIDETMWDFILTRGYLEKNWSYDGSHPDGWVHKNYYEEKLKDWVLS